MEALRETVHVTHNVLHLHLPPVYNNRDVEVIVLPTDSVDVPFEKRRRHPSASLAGTRIVDDIMTPAVPDSEWDVLRETAS
jgi:hypothetical protein